MIIQLVLHETQLKERAVPVFGSVNDLRFLLLFKKTCPRCICIDHGIGVFLQVVLLIICICSMMWWNSAYEWVRAKFTNNQAALVYTLLIIIPGNITAWNGFQYLWDCLVGLLTVSYVDWTTDSQLKDVVLVSFIQLSFLPWKLRIGFIVSLGPNLL